MRKYQQGFAHLYIILLIAVVLAAAGFAGWKVFSADDTDKNAQQSDSNASGSSEAQSSAEASSEAETLPSADTLENIKASITSDNTAALEGYMAASVNVILAATEAYGPQTPTQAITDLEYVAGATDPWDLALPAATLATYKAGGYSSYFPDNALVGKSADNYLVSFQFDSAGKINGIFITSHAETLGE